jgi:hypothetical protein
MCRAALAAPRGRSHRHSAGPRNIALSSANGIECAADADSSHADISQLRDCNEIAAHEHVHRLGIDGVHHGGDVAQRCRRSRGSGSRSSRIRGGDGTRRSYRQWKASLAILQPLSAALPFFTAVSPGHSCAPSFITQMRQSARDVEKRCGVIGIAAYRRNDCPPPAPGRREAADSD